MGPLFPIIAIEAYAPWRGDRTRLLFQRSLAETTRYFDTYVGEPSPKYASPEHFQLTLAIHIRQEGVASSIMTLHATKSRQKCTRCS